MADSQTWGITPLLGSELVEVTVGHRQTFHIHKSLLSHKSPAFKAALDGRFSEGRDNRLNLPDEEPASFGMLVHWLYTGQIAYQYADIHFDEVGEDEPFLYFRLLQAADKSLIPELQQQCYTMTRKTIGSQCPDMEFLRLVCSNPLGSPMLKFYLANVFAYHILLDGSQPSWFDDMLEKQPDFAVYTVRVITWRMRVPIETVISIPEFQDEHPADCEMFDSFAFRAQQEDEFRLPQKIFRPYILQYEPLSLQRKLLWDGEVIPLPKDVEDLGTDDEVVYLE